MAVDNQIKVELQEYMGSDRSIAEAAWTSSASMQAKSFKTDAQVESLVKRLAADGHSTPFESVIMRFWIKMPIQTDRQHMTHRIGSHNGMSGRYRTMPNEYLGIPSDISVILSNINERRCQFVKSYHDLCRSANMWYQDLITDFKEAEIAGEITNKEYKRLREFYRGVLPQNNMTERVTIFNLRSFANYQRLRNSEHAQPEIKKVAELMLEEVKAKNIAPVAIAALEAIKWRI